MKKIIKDALFWMILALLVGGAVFINKYENTQEKEKIVGVHVKGEVSAPGYYELPYGSRVKDAVKYAGCETKKADLASLNLAMKLRDGEELIIPKKGEIGESDEGGKININTADTYNLCKLEGIGEKLAGRIIEYRVTKGNFKTIEALKKVSGIGEENFNKIKDKITV